MKTIIGLVGEKLAGKDTTANYLVEKYSADHFRFTHILDAILEDLDMEISRKNEITLGMGLRKAFGEHVLINAVEDRIKKSWASFIVVNGIRMDELDIVKSWGAKTIYVTAPVEVRFQRYQTRKEKADDALLNFEQFKEQENGPTEQRIPELGTKADFKIENTGSLEELYGKVDEILKQIKV
jgi:dephospho-CoA kinase